MWKSHSWRMLQLLSHNLPLCGRAWRPRRLLHCFPVKFLTALLVPHSHRLLLIPQYTYETNEKGDKVVLGKGTYGVVYAGRDLSNQVRIAIKEIPEKDST